MKISMNKTMISLGILAAGALLVSSPAFAADTCDGSTPPAYAVNAGNCSATMSDGATCLPVCTTGFEVAEDCNPVETAQVGSMSVDESVAHSGCDSGCEGYTGFDTNKVIRSGPGVHHTGRWRWPFKLKKFKVCVRYQVNQHDGSGNDVWGELGNTVCKPWLGLKVQDGPTRSFAYNPQFKAPAGITGDEYRVVRVSRTNNSKGCVAYQGATKPDTISFNGVSVHDTCLRGNTNAQFGCVVNGTLGTCDGNGALAEMSVVAPGVGYMNKGCNPVAISSTCSCAGGLCAMKDTQCVHSGLK